MPTFPRFYDFVAKVLGTTTTTTTTEAPIPCEEYIEAAPVVWPIWWRSEFDGRTVRHEAPSTLLF